MISLYDLVILAVIIPVLALLGHLFVAYSLAPKRAKLGILDALANDDAFQSELVKALLDNLFKEQSEGEKKYVPIDLMISRAKAQFSEWIKGELPKAEDQAAAIMPMQQDEYGNPQPDIVSNIILSQIPKKYRGMAMLAMKYLKP